MAAICGQPEFRCIASLVCSMKGTTIDGRDERMSVKSYFEGQTFMYEIVKSLAKASE